MSEPQFTLEDMVALETRISELEEQRDAERAARATELEEWTLKLATERAAHEATRGERDLMQSQKSALARRVLELEGIKPLIDGLSLQAAEQRVTELEALLRKHVPECMAGLGIIAQQSAALSSARELLQHAYDCMDNDGPFAGCMSDIDTWLRANPDTATPAAARDARLQAQGFEPVSEEQREQNRLVNLGQAALLATQGLALVPAAERAAHEATKAELTKTENEPETKEEHRARLAPVLAQLDAADRSTYLDLFELLEMVAERHHGSLLWESHRVTVHVRTKRVAEKRALKWRNRA